MIVPPISQVSLGANQLHALNDREYSSIFILVDKNGCGQIVSLNDDGPCNKISQLKLLFWVDLATTS